MGLQAQGNLLNSPEQWQDSTASCSADMHAMKSSYLQIVAVSSYHDVQTIDACCWLSRAAASFDYRGFVHSQVMQNMLRAFT